jgi:UDP-N-acetylglucosamine 4-epimerase
MSTYSQLKVNLQQTPCTWLVTGAAGFIGSNLVETLLQLDQKVVGFDNFATGHRKNLDEIKNLVTASQWDRFNFIEGDLRELSMCRHACKGVDYVLHQGALGSVPRSLVDPALSHDANVTGSLNVMIAARDNQLKRFVYASSSSIYGDEAGLPKREDKIGNPLSPYAATKWMDEIYAGVFHRNFGLDCVGLRYFNVFGPRQDPEGAYAAVIPKWLAAMLKGERVYINGDGETSRDFCYIRNVVQANLLAATSDHPDAVNQAYNVAVGERTSLNQLFAALREGLSNSMPGIQIAPPVYQAFREGDVRHSLADISKATQLLGYRPTHGISDGLKEAMAWYQKNVI